GIRRIVSRWRRSSSSTGRAISGSVACREVPVESSVATNDDRTPACGEVSCVIGRCSGQCESRKATRGGEPMPPRGVKKGTKRARQYEHVKRSERQAGRSQSRAKEIAARTVQKERARSGESRQRSRSSTRDISSGRRGGKRSGSGPGGRTRDQLYNDAKRLGVEGRSRMSKRQLQAAVA